MSDADAAASVRARTAPRLRGFACGRSGHVCAAMTTEWDEPEEGEESEEDPGFLGGGGPARIIEGDAEEELDEHGDNLDRVDEGEL